MRVGFLWSFEIWAVWLVWRAYPSFNVAMIIREGHLFCALSYPIMIMFRDTLLLLVIIWTHNPFKCPVSQLVQLWAGRRCIVVGRRRRKILSDAQVIKVVKFDVWLVVSLEEELLLFQQLSTWVVEYVGPFLRLFIMCSCLVGCGILSTCFTHVMCWYGIHHFFTCRSVYICMFSTNVT